MRNLAGLAGSLLALGLVLAGPAWGWGGKKASETEAFFGELHLH